jgi:excisionase family DNA binding protein
MSISDKERGDVNDGAGTVLPPKDAAVLESVTAFLRDRGSAELVACDGDTRIPLPDEMFAVLCDVAELLRQGKAVRVTHLSQRLTTSQAADILGVSRPTLIRLLEEKRIPYEQPRRHRLLRLDDVISYQRRRQAELHGALDDMTSQAVADGLYDTSAEDYRAALKRRSGSNRKISPELSGAVSGTAEWPGVRRLRQVSR